jgi:hypothetical protein
LKKNEIFPWNLECDQSFNILKDKLSSDPILTYPNRQVEFHVQIHASSMALSAFLAQLGEGNLDHPIYFVSRDIIG